ncbi:hypothetical protein [Rhodococcoides fascians]|uniref:hypothetical protein n=1 Tax=Rhodococcoides fascians TaxID=1828 RepID=UPI00050CDAFD|nr:hypothetical protein [Rhodococcus fascians]
MIGEEQFRGAIDNPDPLDIWLLNEDGSTSIVPDQDPARWLDPESWPRYLCRTGAVAEHQARWGADTFAYLDRLFQATVAGEEELSR